MTTMRTVRWRAAIATAAAGVLVSGCGTGGGDPAVQPDEPVRTPAVGLAEEVPASLAFVDQSVAPSVATIATGAGTIGVHSAPDRLYTRVGTIRGGDTVGLTGNRAGVEGVEWAEMIWQDGTAWIPTSALAS